nr:MAG TPA: hypothetical protein [Caudoviricetes sp.]
MAMSTLQKVNLLHLQPTKENDQRFFSSLEGQINEVSLRKKLLRSLATHGHTIISCTMVIASGDLRQSNARDSKLYLMIIPQE